MKKILATDKAPAAIGPYSQGVVAGNTMVHGFVFTSGQLGLDPVTGLFPEGGIQAQTRQSLENVKAVLAADGLGMENVVKTTVFLQSMDDFAAMNAIYAAYFPGDYPARSAVEVAKLPKGGLVEIEAVAFG